MVAITSKVQICNMALNHLGNTGTVSNIDTPVNDKEITFARWYDVSLDYALKLAMPNFSLSRRIVSKKDSAPEFGYGNAYEYPNDCLKVLGFGEIDAKEFGFTIEGNDILLDENFTEGLKLRFIRRVTDVNAFSPEFVIIFSWVLAANVALAVTQDLQKRAAIMNTLPGKWAELSALNAQENPPIRKSVSKFKQARYSYPIRNNQKR